MESHTDTRRPRARVDVARAHSATRHRRRDATRDRARARVGVDGGARARDARDVRGGRGANGARDARGHVGDDDGDGDGDGDDDGEARKGKRQAMEVTPEASRRIKALLDARQKEYLKIGVKTRGCNGMTYTMNYADESERKKFDELVTTEDGVKIIVEPNALMSIIGTKMDYVSDRLRSEFVFENPNSKAQCGCGESFTV